MVIRKNVALDSHSDATVSLLMQDQQLCVLKQADRNDERFAASIAKQKHFQPIALGGLSISSAQILRETVQDDRLNVVMRYVNGMTGEDFALEGNREIAQEISRGLSALLIDGMARSAVREVETALFLDKMAGVKSATRWPSLQAALADAELTLAEALQGRQTIAVPVGPCHGDLTLSNVILSQSQGFVLIDFLATFLDSPLQDLAKISQDLEFGWSFRRLDLNLRIKAQVFNAIAMPSYAHYLYELFPLAAYLFKLLCLARIAPYVGDQPTADWLAKALACAFAQRPAG